MARLPVALIGLSLGLSACSIISTHPSRNGSFEGTEVPLDLERERREAEFRRVRNEMGFKSHSALTDYQAHSLRQRVELQKLEKTLQSQSEKRQYFQYKPHFKNDQQRIDFLRRRDIKDRERLAHSLGIVKAMDDYSPFESKAIESADVFVGMSRRAVRTSWGEPETVEIAGNPIFGNERWLYSSYEPSSEGFILEKKTIYFEGGRVVGWEKR